MKRKYLILLALTALWISAPSDWAAAADGGRHGHAIHGGHGGGHNGGHGHGHAFGRGSGHGFGGGFGLGFGGGYYDDGWDLAELYRELYHNLPYFSLHPPVYYSLPVPRTYGYSPFAYPPGVMTPELVGEVKPQEVMNPFVPASPQESADAKQDRAAAREASAEPQPLVIVNPFVTPNRTVVQSER